MSQKRREHLQKKRREMGGEIYQRTHFPGEYPVRILLWKDLQRGAGQALEGKNRFSE